jgi:hypothetical protein
MRLKPHHALNAPGDFYVEDGCCTSCEVPFQEAPGHFKTDSTGHCYVCKQPSNPDEVNGMIRAVWVSEVSCIRYAGNSPEILKKLSKLGEGAQCDALASHTYPWDKQEPGLLQRLSEFLRALRRR